MTQDKISIFEERKLELEKKLADKEEALRSFSKKVSETQIEILEVRGQLNEVKLTIKLLKEK